MKKINYSDDLRQAWAKSDGNRDALVAKTAIAAVLADPEVTAKAFVESTREAGFQAAGAVFQAALKTAKEAGSTEAGVAAAAKTAREKIAADSREKRRKAKAKADAKAAAKAEADALAAKALTNKELAADLAERNLKAEAARLADLDVEVMRLTLEGAKSRRLLAAAGVEHTSPLTAWTEAGYEWILHSEDDRLLVLRTAEAAALAEAAAAAKVPEAAVLAEAAAALVIRRDAAAIVNK